VIPNLLKDFCDTMRWIFPLLLVVVFLCLFTVNHLQARIEEDWFNRLRQSNRSQRDGAVVSAGISERPRTDGACRVSVPRGDDVISPRRAPASYL
jgi:hypothetical protein